MKAKLLACSAVVLLCCFLHVDRCQGQARTWTNYEGKTFEATIKRVDKDKGLVVLQANGGKERSVPAAILSKKDQNYLAFRGVKIDKAFRVWTLTANDKKFVAKVLKSEDGKVELQNAYGKNAIVKLNALSRADRQFVKTLDRKPRRLLAGKDGRCLKPLPKVEAILDIAVEGYDEDNGFNRSSMTKAVARILQLDIDEGLRGLGFHTYKQFKTVGLDPRTAATVALEGAYESARDSDFYAARFDLAKDVLDNSRDIVERAVALYIVSGGFNNETSSHQLTNGTEGRDRTEDAKALVPLQRELLQSGNTEAEMAAVMSTLMLAELATPNRDLVEKAYRKHWPDGSLSSMARAFSKPFGE